MDRHKRTACFAQILALGTILACAWPAHADTLSAHDISGEAELTYRVLSTAVDGQTQPWWWLTLTVRGWEVAFTAGDSVYVAVIENNVIRDDTLWDTVVKVTPDEITAQLMARDFVSSECRVAHLDTTDRVLEIHAAAWVRKRNCGFTCADDRPYTSPLSVSYVLPVSVATMAGNPLPTPLWPNSGIIDLRGRRLSRTSSDANGVHVLHGRSGVKMSSPPATLSCGP
jgi:hypothetical protein